MTGSSSLVLMRPVLRKALNVSAPPDPAFAPPPRVHPRACVPAAFDSCSAQGRSRRDRCSRARTPTASRPSSFYRRSMRVCCAWLALCLVDTSTLRAWQPRSGAGSSHLLPVPVFCAARRGPSAPWRGSERARERKGRGRVAGVPLALPIIPEGMSQAMKRRAPHAGSVSPCRHARPRLDTLFRNFDFPPLSKRWKPP